MSTLDTFTLFPRLPQELRLKIWQSTIEPRILPIKWSQQLSQCVTQDNPAILRLTHESREEGLKTYRPSFGTASNSQPVIYANFTLDTVSFEWETAYGQLSHFTRGYLKTALKQVKSLTIHKDDFEYQLEEPWVSLLSEFSELEILLVTGCGQVSDRPLISKPLAMEEDIKTTIWGAGPDEKSDAMPTLVCLDRGYECPTHWWFKQCNEWCPRRMGRGTEEFEKPDWLSIISSVDDVATEYSQA
jgi:2EXR family